MAIAFIPFLECIIHGTCREIREGLGDLSNAGWKRYTVINSALEIRIMTLNNIRKYITLKEEKTFAVGYSMLMYAPEDLVNEHEVDEKRWRNDNHPIQ